MSIRAFYLGFHAPLWMDAFAELRRRGVLTPLYWTASQARLAEIRRDYPGVVAQDVVEAIRGIPAPEAARLPQRPLEAELLHQLAWQQCTALSMMDRMDPGGAFLYPERVRLYHRHLRYWSAILDHLRPQVVLFPVTPHAIYDYVVYGLCKLRGIPTLMVGTTGFNRFYLFWDMEAGPEDILAAYRDGLRQGPPPFELPPHAQSHYEHISRLDNANYLLTYRRYLDRLGGEKPSGVQAVKRAVAGLWPGLREAYRFFTAPAPANYLKRPGKTIEESSFSGLEWRLMKRGAYRRKRELARLYADMCDPVDFQKPYVYFPMHYQPENTTCPNGDAYNDQLLATALLAEALPPGWELYIKEYPNIFDYKLNGERARSESFYRDLRAIDPRIRLLPIAHSSFELIDRSAAVATVTGSAGWEAVCRGKPVITLGHAWYNGCEGVFYAPRREQCREALAWAARHPKVDQERVRYFLHVFAQHCLTACADQLFVKEFDLTAAENAGLLADAIANACRERLS